MKCGPGQAPCPTCGKLGTRKNIHQRLVRTIAYKQIVYLDITYGEYRARCDCCITFRNTPPGVEPRALYDNQVRDAVLDRILEHGMSTVSSTTASTDRCGSSICRTIAVGSWLASSGTLCIDELHLGHYTLLLATDPLQDLPVAFALISSNDHDHMRRFLENLKNWGVEPEVVVTDGSGLYPAVLAELWPQARHQLCVFHV